MRYILIIISLCTLLLQACFFGEEDKPNCRIYETEIKPLDDSLRGTWVLISAEKNNLSIKNSINNNGIYGMSFDAEVVNIDDCRNVQRNAEYLNSSGSRYLFMIYEFNSEKLYLSYTHSLLQDSLCLVSDKYYSSYSFYYKFIEDSLILKTKCDSNFYKLVLKK